MTIRKPHILIVEDHSFVRESLGTFLELYGYQVASASNMADALKLAQAYKLDALLFDVYLPEAQDGWELLSKLRRQRLAPPP